MATLTENIDASQQVIRVTGATPDQGHFRVRIDDELLDVQGFARHELVGGYRPVGVDRTRWVVTRGVSGTTAASHSAGDTLHAAASALVSSADLTPPLPFAGEGGGVQTVRLHEFEFAFDDAFVNNDYAVAATIVNVGYVIYSAIVITEDWVGSGVSADEMTFEVVKDPTGSPQPFLEYAYDVAFTGFTASPQEFSVPPTTRRVIPVSAADQIGIAVWPGAGALSAGAAKLVVLVAEPAAP